MKNVESCPLCGVEDSTEVSAYSELIRLPEGYSVKKCDNCELLRLSPAPNQGESNEHYRQSEYYSADEYNKRAAQKTPFFMERLNFIDNYISRDKILDLGCAGGDFLVVAKAIGWDVCGVEPTQKLAKSAKDKVGKKIFSSLEEAIEQNVKVNCVHSNHSFEHVQNPYQVAMAVSNVLIDGGLFCMEVPHQFGSWQDNLKLVTYKMLGKNIADKLFSEPVDTLHHTFFYTPKTLTNILSKAGFSVEFISTVNTANYQLPFPSLMRKVSYYILDHLFSLFKKGPVIVCVARKS